MSVLFELTEYRGGGVWSILQAEELMPFELETYLHLISVKVEVRATKAASKK